MTTVKAERVAFSSEGVELAGEFRCAVPGRKRPGVVLTGPFTGVKEQVTGTYASLLAEAGFATLAFDHRGFGESGGRPGHEDCQGKLADLRAAAGLLAGTPLLIVHGKADAYCSPELAQAFYERKPGEEEILWLDASQHIDLYDSEPYVTRVAQAAAGFLHCKLTPPAK